MITVITTATSGRLAHLDRQVAGLRESSVEVRHLVVTMQAAFDPPPLAQRSWAVHCPGPMSPGAARNLGARTALEAGAELLIFLDADCIPEPSLATEYARAAEAYDGLLCGPVTYLPPPRAGEDCADLRRDPHPARPNPGNAVCRARPEEYDLFWSLSFAVTARTWERLGGFCERYQGYGAEDTDYGRTARRSGVPMWWVGGAHAFHQYHPVSSPPREHLGDIVANARIFKQRWGDWSMRGWLEAFAQEGLLTMTDEDITLVGPVPQPQARRSG